MRPINFSRHVLPHVIAVCVFLLVTILFFRPVFFENKSIQQGDIQQWSGSSKELRDYREKTGEEGLWAGTMFSGMPAYLVNIKWSDGVVLGMKKALSFFLPHPVSHIFLAFICYYIMLLSFRVRPWLAIAGALAFGLSTYVIIGLSAGHNARIGAIAYMPLVLAGVHLAFSGNRILGFGVTAAGMALHLRENHLQITYYLVLIVAGYGLMQLVLAIRSKQLGEFFKNIVILIPAVVIAAGTFFGQFWAISEYTRYSFRGPSEIAVKSTEDASGLPKWYAFQYKYGVWEPMTLFLPNFYGGSSRQFFVQDQNSASYKALVQSGDNELANQLANYTSAYWGPQDFTIGPYYAGVLVCFLFILGIVFAERKYIGWLVPLSALSLMLSWGDSFSTFNYFMFDYFPGYNKFRSVNFALVIILFSMPLLGLIGLEKLLSLEWNKTVRKKAILPAVITMALIAIFLVISGFNLGSFLKPEELSLPAWFKIALNKDRHNLLWDEAWRAWWLVGGFSICLFVYLEKFLKPVITYVALIVLIWADLALVNSRYFSKDNYVRKRDNSVLTATAADEAILQDKGYYRVYNLQGAMAEARTSYFHHSLGGYHGAKLRRYQDLYDSAITKTTQKLFQDFQDATPKFAQYHVLNMLNAKYFVYGPDRDNVILNPAANGPAWFVKEVLHANSPAEELHLTGLINTKEVAVFDSKLKVEYYQSSIDTIANIRLLEYTPPYLKYESEAAANGLAVFSEVYYPKGWHAFVDGKEVPILRANYVLRALEVPAGKHTIEFKFEPKPYAVGDKITLASSWLLLLTVLGSLGWSLKKSED
ncbi:MAG: YfhO family protein [Cyclobacteriaceae bacterium]|nr:YfhO family protein [Cyclobacteriaceae bacterium]